MWEVWPEAAHLRTGVPINGPAAWVFQPFHRARESVLGARGKQSGPKEKGIGRVVVTIRCCCRPAAPPGKLNTLPVQESSVLLTWQVPVTMGCAVDFTTASKGKEEKGLCHREESHQFHHVSRFSKCYHAQCPHLPVNEVCLVAIGGCSVPTARCSLAIYSCIVESSQRP